MAKLASEIYGKALFSLAVTENAVDELYEEAELLSEVMKTTPEFLMMMNHPKLTREEKEGVIKDVFGGRVSAYFEGFLRVLLDKERFSELPGVIACFQSLVREYKGTGVAYVSSPMALSDKQEKAIEAKLLETTKYKDMEMHYSVDESLIGGLVIKIGDRVVDSSIKTKLEGLTRYLKNSQAV